MNFVCSFKLENAVLLPTLLLDNLEFVGALRGIGYQFSSVTLFITYPMSLLGRIIGNIAKLFTRF